MNWLVRFCATGAYSGLLQPWPGTWGSIPPLIIAYAISQLGVMPLIALALATTVISIWAAGEGEKLLGHDHRSIVIDEWAGMMISVLFLPLNWGTALLAFFFFRLFDVVKLWPARQAESLPGGVGITMDDVAAGVQTNIVMQILLLLFPALGA